MTDLHIFHFDGAVWKDRDNGGWHFITVPGDISEQIKFVAYCDQKPKRSVRVQVTFNTPVGDVSWITSLFPQKEIERYLLPVKQNILTRANLTGGDTISVQLKL